MERDRGLTRQGATEPQLLRRVPARLLAVAGFEQTDGVALKDEGQHEDALLAVAPHERHFGRVGAAVVGVHGHGGLVVEDAPGGRELAQVEHTRGRPAPAAGVVLGQHADRLEVGQILHDLAGVAAAEPGHVAGDLGQQLALVEPGGDVEGGLHEGLELALAGPPRLEVAAVADRPGELLDIVARDAAVAAGGAHAGQKARRRPAPHRGRRDAELAGRLAEAQVHAASATRAACRASFGRFLCAALVRFRQVLHVGFGLVILFAWRVLATVYVTAPRDS